MGSDEIGLQSTFGRTYALWIVVQKCSLTGIYEYRPQSGGLMIRPDGLLRIPSLR
jgi:hypothetical protein